MNNTAEYGEYSAGGGEFVLEQGGGNTIIKLTPNSKTVVNTDEHLNVAHLVTNSAKKKEKINKQKPMI